MKFRFSAGIMCLVACVLQQSAWAADVTKLGMPDKAAEKHFFPLDAARGEQAKAPLTLAKETKPYVLRSDKRQLEEGGMRIDRAKTVPVITPVTKQKAAATPEQVPDPATTSAAKAPLIMTPDDDTNTTITDRESEEIEGNTETYNPVLTLFDSGGDAPLQSFGDAMRGGVAAIAGMMKHLIWPIPLNAQQYISSGYGMRKDPFHGRQAFHGGIDIAAPEGTPVLATADGRVVAVETDRNYGKYITLAHADGTLTRYGHLSAQRVAVGQQVKAGQTIGAVGSTGRATGAHLDYRVSKDGMKYDPYAILTVPSNLAVGAAQTAAKSTGNSNATARYIPTRGSPGVANNALPKHPMVIKVE